MRFLVTQFQALVTAVQFLTRLPLGIQVSLEERVVRTSLTWFPGVGFLLGGILYLVFLLADRVFAPPVTAALLVAAGFVLTGGLHIDGFIDTMDALLSGRTREKKLEIMRDSRVGAMGVYAALVLLLGKYAIYASLVPATARLVLLLTPVAARWSLIFAIVFYPSARVTGLGHVFHAAGGREPVIGATLLAILIFLATGGWPALGLLAAAWVVTQLGAIAMNRVLGGLTGDTYGTLVEVAEVIVGLLVLGLV